ncbi:MAG: hypothetical protein QM489_00445 [Candidatus Izemoplasma sp.]
MQVTKQTVTTIQLSLTEDEAKWLKGYLQNPPLNPNDPGGYRLDKEPKEDRIYRENLFNSL